MQSLKLVSPSHHPKPISPPHQRYRCRRLPISFSLKNNPSTSPITTHPPPPSNPLVVVGSANADIYVEISRLPKEGETISAKSGQTLAGGKGANQAACGGKLSYPTYFIGQVGEDAHGKLVTEALEAGGVYLECLKVVSNVPTGHAVVMLQGDGQNSIIIVGGANINSWPQSLADEDLELVRRAGVLLLQREIPDTVNIQVAKAAKSAGVPVILDAGGMEGELPVDLLTLVDILSPNETELSRLTGMSTDTFEQIHQAVVKCHEMIHSKRRNRLEHKRLNDLVYVRYNQILHHRYQKRDSIDPISLKDIDDSNEWLTGQMESLDLDEGGDGTGAPDLVFPGEDLDWAMVSEAAGVDEPQARTRAKGKAPASTSNVYQRRGRARQAQVEEEEEEDVDVDEDEDEEEEFVCDDDDSDDYPEEDATYDNDSP